MQNASAALGGQQNESGARPYTTHRRRSRMGARLRESLPRVASRKKTMVPLGALLLIASLLTLGCAARPAEPTAPRAVETGAASAPQAGLTLQASYSSPVMSQSPILLAQE